MSPYIFNGGTKAKQRDIKVHFHSTNAPNLCPWICAAILWLTTVFFKAESLDSLELPALFSHPRKVLLGLHGPDPVLSLSPGSKNSWGGGRDLQDQVPGPPGAPAWVLPFGIPQVHISANVKPRFSCLSIHIEGIHLELYLQMGKHQGSPLAKEHSGIPQGKLRFPKCSPAGSGPSLSLEQQRSYPVGHWTISISSSEADGLCQHTADLLHLVKSAYVHSFFWALAPCLIALSLWLLFWED